MQKTTKVTVWHSLTVVESTFILNLIKIDRIGKRLKLKKDFNSPVQLLCIVFWSSEKYWPLYEYKVLLF